MEYTLAEVAERLKQRAIEQGVDPALAFGLLVAENSKDGEWNPTRKLRLDTVSPMKAFGVMQVMPSTHQGLIRTGYLPASNKMATLDEQLDAGLAAIKEKVASIGSTDPSDVAVRYNASSAVYPRWKEFGVAALPPETRHYITKVTRAMQESGMQPTQAATPVAASGQALMQPFQSAVSQYTTLLDALLGQQQQSAAEQKAALQRTAQATEKVLRADTDAGVAREVQGKAIVEATGADVLAPTSAIAAANRTFQQTAALEEALGLKVQQLQSVSALDNPIGWFLGQLELNGVSKQLASVTARKQAAAQTLNQIHATTRNQLDVNPAAVADAAVRASEGKIAAAKAKADADAAAIDISVRNEQMNVAKVKMQMAGETLGRQLQIKNMEEENIRWQYQQSLRRGESEKDAAEVAPFNAVLAKYGKDPIGKLSHMAKYDKQTQDLLTRLSGTDSMGKDLAEVLQVANAIGAFPTLERTGKGALANFLRQFQEESKERLALIQKRTDGSEKALKGLSPEEQLAYAGREVWKTWETNAATLSHDRLQKGNPWKLNIQLAAQSPELQKNPLTAYVTARLKAGPAELREKDLIDFLAASPEQPAVKARYLQEFVAKGLEHQFVAMGVGLAGISMADPKKDNARERRVRYRVDPEKMLDGYGAFGLFSAGRGMPQLDLTNLGDAQNLMVKIQRAQQNPSEVTLQGASLPQPLDLLGIIPKEQKQ